MWLWQPIALTASGPIEVNVDVVTLTLSTVTNTILNEVSVSPNTLTLSTVTNTLTLEINAAPVSLTFSIVTNNVLNEVGVPPVTVTFSAITSIVVLEVSPSPVTLTLSTVVNTVALELNIAPITLLLTTVTSTQEISVNTIPVTLIFSSVDVSLIGSVNVTPVTLDLSIIANSVEIQTNVSPVLLTFETVNPTLLTEINVGVVTLVFSTVDLEIDDGTVAIITVPTKIYDNIFDAFNTIGNLAASGFVLENTEIPFTNLALISNTLGSKYSCGTRLEHGYYQLTTITEDLNELIDLQDELEELFTFKTFELNSPYLLTLLELQERSHKELEPQLIRGILAYNVIVEKTISKEYANTITSGETLYHAIHNRFLQFPDIQEFIQDLTTSGFTAEGFNGLDYIILPEVSSTLDFNTSQSKVDSYEIPICFFSEDLNYLLKIRAAVENVYDYCRLVIKGRPTRPSHKHLIFDWQSCEIVEMQPQLWCGKINYNVLVESEVHEYN